MTDLHEQIELVAPNGVAYNDYRREWFAIIGNVAPPTFRRLDKDAIYEALAHCFACGGAGTKPWGPLPGPCPECGPLRNLIMEGGR